MFSLFGKKDERARGTIVVVDVGSGSVGAALITRTETGLPAVVAQTRVAAPIVQSRDIEALAERTYTAVREALSSTAGVLRARGSLLPHSHASDVALFLPAPWSSISLRTIRVASRKPFAVNPAVLERLILEHFRDEKTGENEQVLERTAVGIRINGYSVHNAHDIPAKAGTETLELTVVSATAPRQILSRLRDIAEKIFGSHVPVTFHSTSVAAARVLSATHPLEPDFIVCNSEGELAEFLFVSEHIPQGTATSTMGSAAFLRTVATHAGMTPAELSSALKLARAEGSPMSERLAPTLRAAMRECAEGFRAATAPLLKTLGAPPTMYMVGTGPESAWYTDSIAAAPFLRNLFPASVSVRAVEYPTISSHLGAMPGSSFSGVAARGGDVFLALEAICANVYLDDSRSSASR